MDKESKRVYLVDSENVGDLWVTHILDLAKKEDEVVVFYTQKSPHMGYDALRKLLSEGREVKFVKCVEGRNALDFQLVTELGYRIGIQKEEMEYIMVTNDTGFDAVVKYWQGAGKKVRRFNARYCQQQYNKLKVEEKKEELLAVEVPFVDEKEVLASSIEEVVDAIDAVTTEEEVSVNETNQVEKNLYEKSLDEETLLEQGESSEEEQLAFKSEEELTVAEQTSMEEMDEHEKSLEEQNKDENQLLEELVHCLGLNNSGEIHNALTMFLGNEGKTVYQQKKGNLKEMVSKKKLNEEEKFKKYCKLVFEQSEKKEKCPKNFASFVYDAKDKRKNLNSFRSALQKEYGKEKGMQYYNLVKPHVKILNKIQK